MKLYNSVGPNPHMVRMFMAEKGIEMDMVDVDIRGGENRQPEYVNNVNASGQCPALVMENGDILAEITAICEYLDEKGDGPSLIGDTPEERAETRMWTRRIDLGICEPLGAAFRFGPGLKMFQSRMHTIPSAAGDFAEIAQKKMTWLDEQMAGRDFVCGDRLTMADILLFAFLSFGASFKQGPTEEHKNLTAWMERMKARPSADA
ncbi:glutathione S-transferase family protein [Minwuia sp.]|uniref:glutathione S-transferase family protein n=1 Tax=Minwuia sp. TaxID=2493630 RepID=UPI003A9101EB